MYQKSWQITFKTLHGSILLLTRDFLTSEEIDMNDPNHFHDYISGESKEDFITRIFPKISEQGPFTKLMVNPIYAADPEPTYTITNNNVIFNMTTDQAHIVFWALDLLAAKRGNPKEVDAVVTKEIDNLWTIFKRFK